MKMYNRVGERRETCNLGCDHLVGMYVVSEWTPTGETFDHDTGYGVEQGRLFTDEHGNIGRSYPTVDYPAYKMDGDFWYSRPRKTYNETAQEVLA